jgi:hypothetical protein
MQQGEVDAADDTSEIGCAAAEESDDDFPYDDVAEQSQPIVFRNPFDDESDDED